MLLAISLATALVVFLLVKQPEKMLACAKQAPAESRQPFSREFGLEIRTPPICGRTCLEEPSSLVSLGDDAPFSRACGLST